MTTCVYCKKDINAYGDYEPYNCSKLTKSNAYWEDVCERCRFYIPEGKEVPVP